MKQEFSNASKSGTVSACRKPRACPNKKTATIAAAFSLIAFMASADENNRVPQANKYELIQTDAAVLYRVKALRDFGHVHAGDVGGRIGGMHNLSQDGDAWVADNAQVSGEARVVGNAQVSGNAAVTGSAQVSGDAWVNGNAQCVG
jgi:hypothetical protein